VSRRTIASGALWPLIGVNDELESSLIINSRCYSFYAKANTISLYP
jgi:hypothetical protein